MKKSLIKVILATLLAITIAFPFAAAAYAAGPEGQSSKDAAASSVQSQSLTADEVYWLTYMREEEKLARDVYNYLYDKWQLRIFSNISKSEQRHTDSVKALLESYGVPDLSVEEPGKFANPDLQALYDDLIKQGSTSLVDALKVGVLIEETDIADLDKAISATSHGDIENVYSNLKNGSLNHLKAFNTNISKR